MDDQNISNTIKYELYLSKPPDNDLIRRYRDYLSTLASDDEFDLDLESHPTENLCLGEFKFDHNIEREWLLVYLLFELSKYDQDLVIKVQDDDGDILLIEAAEHLPEWLESKESENRVFIHNGLIHIIPRNVNLNDLQQPVFSPALVAHSAAKFIRENTTINTTAGSSIQNAIKKQLSGLPNKEEWLAKKFQQLDEIISVKDFNESLTLASVMNMTEEDLEISPISSVTSNSMSSSATSLSSETSSSSSNKVPLELQND